MGKFAFKLSYSFRKDGLEFLKYLMYRKSEASAVIGQHQILQHKFFCENQQRKFDEAHNYSNYKKWLIIFQNIIESDKVRSL